MTLFVDAGLGFNDPGFVDKVTGQMRFMRGRELPGFQNHQVFYGFMVRLLEVMRMMMMTMIDGDVGGGGRRVGRYYDPGHSDVRCLSGVGEKGLSV
jgi:hypothetical protein